MVRWWVRRDTAGSTALADQRVFGWSALQGFEGYADQAGAVHVFGGVGVILATATVARPSHNSSPTPSQCGTR
jgi:hypothetical protein